MLENIKSKMHVLFLVLLAVGAVSADISGVLSALQLLQEELRNDFKVAQVHALLDLDSIVQDTEKDLGVLVKDPVKGIKELVTDMKKDLAQAKGWAEVDYDYMKSHIEDAIETIKEEMKSIRGY